MGLLLTDLRHPFVSGGRERRWHGLGCGRCLVTLRVKKTLVASPAVRSTSFLLKSDYFQLWKQHTIDRECLLTNIIRKIPSSGLLGQGIESCAKLQVVLRRNLPGHPPRNGRISRDAEGRPDR
jgi:hypothetical protein